jgi:hypothetical protein
MITQSTIATNARFIQTNFWRAFFVFVFFRKSKQIRFSEKKKLFFVVEEMRQRRRRSVFVSSDEDEFDASATTPTTWQSGGVWLSPRVAPPPSSNDDFDLTFEFGAGDDMTLRGTQPHGSLSSLSNGRNRCSLPALSRRSLHVDKHAESRKPPQMANRAKKVSKSPALIGSARTPASLNYSCSDSSELDEPAEEYDIPWLSTRSQSSSSSSSSRQAPRTVASSMPFSRSAQQFSMSTVNGNGNVARALAVTSPMSKTRWRQPTHTVHAHHSGSPALAPTAIGSPTTLTPSVDHLRLTADRDEKTKAAARELHFDARNKRVCAISDDDDDDDGGESRGNNKLGELYLLNRVMSASHDGLLSDVGATSRTCVEVSSSSSENECALPPRKRVEPESLSKPRRASTGSTSTRRAQQKQRRKSDDGDDKVERRKRKKKKQRERKERRANKRKKRSAKRAKRDSGGDSFELPPENEFQDMLAKANAMRQRLAGYAGEQVEESPASSLSPPVKKLCSPAARQASEKENDQVSSNCNRRTANAIDDGDSLSALLGAFPDADEDRLLLHRLQRTLNGGHASTAISGECSDDGLEPPPAPPTTPRGVRKRSHRDDAIEVPDSDDDDDDDDMFMVPKQARPTVRRFTRLQGEWERNMVRLEQIARRQQRLGGFLRECVKETPRWKALVEEQRVLVRRNYVLSKKLDDMRRGAYFAYFPAHLDSQEG